MKDSKISAFDAMARLVGGLRSIRVDSWQNALTGLGFAATDKTMSHTPSPVVRLTDETLERMYHGGGLPARIVDLPVDDAMRGGCEHYGPEGVDEDDVQKISKRFDELGCWDHVRTAARYGRLYGTGAVLIGARDGGLMSEPLDLGRVREIQYLMDLDGTEYYPASYYDDPDDERYGEPQTYQINTTCGQSAMSVVVHESRMVQCGGAPTSRRKRMEYYDRDYSVLQRVYDELRRFDSDRSAASAMMTDGSIGVMKIRGFYEAITGGHKDTFSTRMQLVNLGLSSSRILPIDKDGEEFSRVERTFTGVADMMQQSMLILSSEIGWPATVLFGRSPAGLDATGDGDDRIWTALVRSSAQEHIIPAATAMQRLVLAEAGIQPDGWGVRLPPLSEETAKEAAERRKLIADADAVYIQSGVYTPDEIALTRVVDGEWTDYAPEIGDEGRAAREETRGQDYAGQPDPADEEPIPARAEPAEPEPAEIPIPPDAVNPAAAYTGVQTTAMTTLVMQTASGEIPPESAVEILVTAYPVDREAAERIIRPAAAAAAEAARRRGGMTTDSYRTDPDVPGSPPTEWSGSMHAQSVTFPLEGWSESAVTEWLDEHDYRSVSIAKEGNRWRARQYNPSYFEDKSFRIRELDDGIQLVLGRVRVR